MAEGLVNHFLSDKWEAVSAGTEPSGYVHPFAVAVMAELDIDITRQRSKAAGEFSRRKFDRVITVCDDAAENCPVWLGNGQTQHIGFVDPAAAVGPEPARLNVFRQVRDQIKAQIIPVLTGQ